MAADHRHLSGTIYRRDRSALPKLIVFAVSLLVLSGCSTVRLAYQQLDWLLEARVEEYVTLDSEQRRHLRADIDALLHWHCRTQVQGYGEWLRRVNADFQHTVSLHQVRIHGEALEDAWFRIMAHSIPMLADLTTSLSEEQVRELLSGLQRHNDEYRADYIDPPQAKRRNKSAKWMRKALKRWVGRLTPAQERAVDDWSRQLALMGDTGWRNRMRWQAELAMVLDRRHDREAVVAGLQRLLLHWREQQDAEYNRRYDANSELTAALLVEISRTLTPRQRARLQKKTLRYAADLEGLYCGADETRATAERDIEGQPRAVH